TQLLFAGAHADVGAGYPTRNEESGLSDIALQWMVERLEARGVQFKGLRPPFAPLASGVAHQPWRHPPWNLLARSVRELKGLATHPSVAARRAATSVLADPQAAPAPYRPP